MKSKLSQAIVFLCLCTAVSCAIYSNRFDRLPRHEIVVDSLLVKTFAMHVNARFSNYYHESITHEDSLIRSQGVEGIVIINPGIEKDSLIIYTFDKKDSCILHFNSLQEGIYEFNWATLPIPKGYYLLQYGQKTDRLSHL